MHATTHEAFGFNHDNYVGTTPQPNGWMADGYAFFAQRRIGPQAERAQRLGLLSLAQVRRAERLGSRLPALVPAQTASLVHGDLWLGNIIPGPDLAANPALCERLSRAGRNEIQLGYRAPLEYGKLKALFDA